MQTEKETVARKKIKELKNRAEGTGWARFFDVKAEGGETGKCKAAVKDKRASRTYRLDCKPVVNLQMTIDLMSIKNL